jgi:hypothetical protein
MEAILLQQLIIRSQRLLPMKYQELGGATLANGAVTQAATTKFDADDTTWTSATFAASHAVIYDDTLTNDDLICSIDFGGSESVTSGTFTLQWHADGIITLA